MMEFGASAQDAIRATHIVVLFIFSLPIHSHAQGNADPHTNGEARRHIIHRRAQCQPDSDANC